MVDPQVGERLPILPDDWRDRQDVGHAEGHGGGHDNGHEDGHINQWS